MNLFQIVLLRLLGLFGMLDLQTELIGRIDATCNNVAALGTNSQRRADFHEALSKAGNFLFFFSHHFRLAGNLCVQHIDFGETLFEFADAQILLAQSLFMLRQFGDASIPRCELFFQAMETGPVLGLLVARPPVKVFDPLQDGRVGLADGCYEAFPWSEYATTLAQNNANLQKYGWPDYEERGI